MNLVQTALSAPKYRWKSVNCSISDDIQKVKYRWTDISVGL